MGKLKLDLDDLRVESFETAIQSEPERGTVVGQGNTESCEITDEYNTCNCANDSAYLWASCGTTCQCPCEVEYYSLYGTVCFTGCVHCEW